MKALDPKSPQVLHEILALGARAHPRYLAIGAAFAGLVAWSLRDILPPAFLVPWLVFAVGLNGLRYAQAREYLLQPPPVEKAPERIRRAAINQGLWGLAWGGLGATVIATSPGSLGAVVAIYFVIALFVSFNASGPASYPPIFDAFLYCAMGPMLAMTALQPGDAYPFLLLAGALFVVATIEVRTARQTRRTT